MAIVFPGGACALSAVDNSRSELILLTPEDGSGANVFLNVYIMNFSSLDKADYQINKNIDRSFIFSTFGHAVTTLTIHGFQSPSMQAINSKGKVSTNKVLHKDMETIYREWCIASPAPKVIRIVTGNSNADGVVTHGTVHRGLMVAFEKKPMGEDKIQGYAFSITFVCQRDGAEHDSPSPDDLNNQNSMAGRDLD